MRAEFMVACLACCAPALAQQPSGEEVMRHTDRDHRARDERGVVEMVLVGEDGSRQRREMEILLKSGEGDDDMNLLRFLSPENVRGTAVLTIEATGRADDQWLYLPALKKKKRIASGNRTQRFAGTDFTFEDLRSEDFTRFTYEVTGSEKTGQDQRDCWVVEASPREGAESGYSKRRIFVDKERYLIWRVEYFDARGELLKTLENREFVQDQGVWRANRSMMEDVQRKTRTAWQFKERQVNPGLPESTFTVGNLERGQ